MLSDGANDILAMLFGLVGTMSYVYFALRLNRANRKRPKTRRDVDD